MNDHLKCPTCQTEFMYMVDLEKHQSVPHVTTPTLPPQQTESVSANPQQNINREGAPDGNNNAEKFDTPEKRATMLKAYCDHLSQGYSKESFPMCTPATFKNYREKYPVEFDTAVIQEAEAKNILFWETIGINGSIGIPVEVNGKKYNKFNALAWKFNVQNRLGWKDRTDVTTDDDKIQAPVIYIPEEDPNK